MGSDQENGTISLTDKIRKGPTENDPDEKPLLDKPSLLRPEARNDSRDPFAIPFHLQVQGATIKGISKTLCPSGLGITTRVTLAPGTPLDLHCSFGKTCYLNLSGQVIHSTPTNTLDPSLNTVGIKFSAVRDWEKKILGSVIEELKQTPSTQAHSLFNITVSKDTLASEISQISVIPTLDSDQLSEWPPLKRQSCIHASKIIGWGSYLPDGTVSNDEINKLINSPDYKNVGQVIESLTGIKNRQYVTNERYPSDLAERAAREALKSAGMDPKDLDVIIFFGISRDFHEPATANVVQEKLSANKAYVYDLANACNGFITAVDTLDSMIASGRCENGLVVTGELISPYIDWEPKTKKDFKQSIFGYTIGDSGGAAVLTRAKKDEQSGIKARWFGSYGAYWRLALAGELQNANSQNKFFKSEGKELEKASIELMPRGFQEITEMLGWNISDIDLVIPHQIPISILKNMYNKTLGIPLEKLFWTFPQYGNLATASMPVAVCEALKRNKLKPANKVLLAGAAAGFSAGYIGIVL